MHTGGTLGMHNLLPITVKRSRADLARDLYTNVPELRALADIDVAVLMNKDSSSMRVSDWKEIGDAIRRGYNKYDGFVVVHGTDTMVFTAAALSFMFKGLSKPVVLTGSQRPLVEIRSDARRNLINSVDLAASGAICEVVIFFDSAVLRGNRAIKASIEEFAAFDSPNWPWLAKVGMEITIQRRFLLARRGCSMKYSHGFDPGVLFLKYFPSMDLAPFIDALASHLFRGVVIEAYGAGNLPSDDGSYLEFLRVAQDKKIPVVIVSQAKQGSVRLDLYETGAVSLKRGAIGGCDITSEAAIVKMMKLLHDRVPYRGFKKAFLTPISGEISCYISASSSRRRPPR